MAELENSVESSAPAEENTFKMVAEADLAYRTQEAAHVFDGAAEEAALARLFDGAAEPTLRAALEKSNLAHKFDGLAEKWRRCASAGDCGARVAAVVEKLEAPHLRPSGIEGRLAETPAACFGLLTLMNNMEGGAP